MLRALQSNPNTLTPALLLAGAVVGAWSLSPSVARAEAEQSLAAGADVAVVLQSEGTCVPTSAPHEGPLVPPEVVIPPTITRAYRTADLDDLTPPPRTLGWL